VIDERDVWQRIGDVTDPELDRSLSALGFVESVEIHGSEVVVNFRLPTYWCAANFAYMMSSDLRERVGQAPGVESVTVRLRDHYAEDEISDGVNAGKTFSETFPGETDGELDELRHTFAVKAFLVRQEQLLRALLRAGYTADRLARLTVADTRVEGDALLVREEAGEGEPIAAPAFWRALPGTAHTYSLHRQKLAGAGLAAGESGPLFVTASGEPLAPDAVPELLRAARTIRLNGAFNTVLCTALNRITHGVEVDTDALCEEPAERRTTGC
jgi:metal-sulfur cluster biosynthetic enzyme